MFGIALVVLCELLLEFAESVDVRLLVVHYIEVFTYFTWLLLLRNLINLALLLLLLSLLVPLRSAFVFLIFLALMVAIIGKLLVIILEEHTGGLE